MERTAESRRKYGEQRIETIVEVGIPKFSFEDAAVRIKWRPTSDDISLVLTNKSANLVKIVWDEALFTDENRGNHRLIHSATGYEDRNNIHPPTVIVARGTIDDFIHPADYFAPEEGYGKRSSGRTVDWRKSPFLPTQIKGTAEELRVRAESVVGKTFRVMLPIEIDYVLNDYTYTFKINGVNVSEKTERIETNSNENRENKMPGRRRGPF